MSTPSNPFSNASMLMKKWFRFGAFGLGAIVVVAGLGLWWLTRGDPPVAVDAGVAAEIAASATTKADAPDTPVVEAGVDGIWTIDTTIGEFSFEDTTASYVGFRIDEVLAGGINTVAVGRTPTLSGAILIEGTSLMSVDIVANLDDIRTNDSRRDNKAREAMNTSDFPEATFSLSSPVDLGADPSSGELVAVQAVGELVINGISQPTTIDITAQLVNGIVVVTGSTEITFADWNITTPSAPIVASLDDFGILEMQLFFTR
ncbi:MAG: YceI family protein [Actinobacteria bacterium]|nr:YceI family protein [Actinomycetota bacterium]